MLCLFCCCCSLACCWSLLLHGRLYHSLTSYCYGFGQSESLLLVSSCLDHDFLRDNLPCSHRRSHPPTFSGCNPTIAPKLSSPHPRDHAPESMSVQPFPPKRLWQTKLLTQVLLWFFIVASAETETTLLGHMCIQECLGYVQPMRRSTCCCRCYVGLAVRTRIILAVVCKGMKS